MDAPSGTPLDKVQVFLAGTGYGALTHSDGSFTIPDLPPGQYVVKAERVGLSAADQVVTVVAGKKIDLTFEMKTVPIPVDGIVIKGSAGG